MSQITITSNLTIAQVIQNIINEDNMDLSISININNQIPVVDQEPSFGDELVTNGTFETDTTGWSVANVGSISSVGGQLVINNTAFVQVTQLVTLETGKTYQYSADFEFVDTNCIYSLNKNASGSISYDGEGANFTETGNSSGQITATQTDLYIIMFIPSTSTVSAKFDNISVREVL